MSESWREILEHAAAGLSIDLLPAELNQIRRSARPAPPPRMRPRTPLRSHSAAEARVLLERELAASATPVQPIQEAGEARTTPSSRARRRP